MALRVLSWNLKHGRAVPARRGDLQHAFAAAVAAWEWDVALLQEVPPWWPPELATRAGALTAALVLTSRNSLLPVRRALAQRWPELMRSGGGSANAILSRMPARPGTHQRRRLCRLPERRWVHGLALEDGTWVANLHATAHDTPAAKRDCVLAARSVEEWAAGAPCVLGGDFNLRDLALPGLRHAGGHDVDHVFCSPSLRPVSCQVAQRGELSDHAPLLVTLERESGSE